MTKALPLAALACAALALAGCDSLRSAAGISKAAPDEFAVVTKAPLIIPPDFNLRPPRPGAPPLNQVLPTQAAQASLFSNDPSAVASTISGNYSEGEKLLLAKSGAVDASPTIRQMIAADNAKLEAADSSFTDRLLFGVSTDKNGNPLNADAEAQRLGAKSAEKVSNETASNEDKSNSDDDSGWFSWLGL